MKQTGVRGSFHAAHDDPRGEKPPRHWHCWHVKAWFPDGQDGRDHLAKLDRMMTALDGQFLAPPNDWGEPLAQMIGEQLDGCVEVEIWRDDERIEARWRPD
jgi:hypothetical protein